MTHLTSRRHPLVAACRDLARGRPDGPARLLLDGPHLVAEALASGIAIESAVLGQDFASSPEGTRLLHALDDSSARTYTASASVLEAMSPVASPAGIVAIASRPSRSLAHVLARRPQLLVVAVDVQDPGNVGAIVRAAEAGGATGAVFCGASADPFAPKALRGSMGSALRLPLVRVADWREAIGAVRDERVRVLATAARTGASVYESDLTSPVAFLLGGEGPGLGTDAIAAAGAAVSIPMAPPVESLNVAVAAALLIYEAARQRRAAGAPRGNNGGAT
jgi:TrmH family RNA methyltransferase